MANNYDEAIKKNRQYLTQAQIDALVAASQQYNNQNAGNRAGALASAREQYDVGYRGLQNMGLAGASGAAPTSGEVPRLQQQIRTPFEDYNNRLRDVERQRLGALGNQFAQQTQAQWAAEAERQRQAQEAAARARAAAAAVGVNTKFAAAIQGVEDAARQAQINAINARGMKQTAQVKQQAFDNGIGSLLSPAEKAQRDGMLRTARPQDVAAAAAFNIAHYAQTTVAERANADQERGIKLTEKLKGNVDSSNANRYYAGPNDTTFSQSEADAEYKSAQQALDNLKLKQHYGGKVSAEEMSSAQNAADIAKVKAEDPEYYSAINTVNSTTATPDAKRKANMVIADRSTTEAVNAMGYKSTMSSAQFDNASKVIPDLRMQLNIIDSTRNRMSNGGTGGQKTIDEAIAELEKHGYTEQEARELVKQFDDERYFRREYDYLNNAYTALFEHQGEKPEKPLNSKEMNPTYWAVNGNVDPEGKTLRNIGKSSTKAIAMRVEEFMTQEQRDAYNAIYEKDGIKAANAYAQAIKPFLEMQAAEADRKYFEEFASDENWLKRFQAWAFVRGSNLLGSIPAMAEKLIVNGQNIVQEGKTNGTGVLKKYSPDSNISRMSNWADIVQSAQAKRILENNQGKVFKNGSLTWGDVLSFGYQTGTSMADSLIAMGLSSALGEGATYALFFSSAGNQAYKDTIARGGTQEQAMGMAILSGAAEAIFEEVSLEKLTQTLHFKGKPFVQVVKNALTQAGVEGSEEFFTSVANILSDMLVMKDKAEIKQAIDNGTLGKYLWDNLGMDAIGGFISGLGFGAASIAGYGASKGINAVVDYKNKKALGGAVKQNTAKMQEIKNAAILLGGETAETVQAVDKKPTNTNVADMTVAVADDIRSLEEKGPDTQAATLALIEGAEMDLQQASDVRSILGEEELTKRGYDASSDEAFQKSYNDKVKSNDMTSRSELQQQSQRQAAAERVWANPEQGLALTSEDGRTVRPMPGNMTAVAKAEQERTGFKTRTTATNGKVTYAISGMEARQGMTNEQIYNEIQNGLTKEARQKAQRYEKLANALGLKMVIHDVMTRTNGFIDSDGNMHVVLSGRQTVLRVTSHELTHHMKEHNKAEYKSLRDHLIKEVGQEKFDDMVKKKAKQYGLDLNTEKGKVEADDEVCAELCERMLSSEEAIERFAEKDTAAAKTLKDRLLKILNAIRAALKDEKFGKDSALIKDQETIETWLSGVTKAIENAEARAKTNEGVIGQVAGTTIAGQDEMIDEIKKAKTDADVDAAIDRACVDVTEYDMEGYARDLFSSGFSQDEITVLFDTMTKAIEQVKLHRAILDFGPMLSEEAQNNPELAAKEIKEMKEGRAYLPYKQNADPHYKLALDFSTLCRKRILLQTIQERLQAKLGRALSQEETVAIRLELQNLQKNNKEEFGKIEVACALCYVEAARLKSPKVINAFLNNTKAEMQNYFAKKNPATKEIIEGKQQEWKVEHGYAPDATKKQMSSSDVTAFNTYSRELREQFESDSVAEQATVDRATRLTKGETVQIGGIKFPGRETFLSASWLEKLKGVEPDIFYAFTDKVRSATRSKAQETDTFYARRDIDMVTEGILGYANAESGFRHQSWSDFVTIHLLDTMASIIEMSTRQAKMHAYTKVPAMVRFLGKTGMMLNMSLIPAGQTGLKLDGTLDFDSVEGMAWETMKELRDMFPDTAGNIAIGINDAQIRELLMSPDIDYVIPYHASGMNKNMRGYMDIKSWAEYTSSQNEKTNHRGAKGKSPELAEWFDEKEAAKAEDGYAFMRAASEKYLQLCAERNLIPKFSQYLTNNGDGSYSLKEGYENYWKLLIDRKMVNQVTGKVILQQAVKPTFDQDTVLGLLEDRITDPTVQQQAKAADLVTEKFGDWQANKNNASAEAIAESKKIRDRSNAITAQKTAEGTRFDLDTDDLQENVQAFTKIDAEAFKAGLEQLKNVTPGKGLFALKDISRFLDTISGGDKELRDTLNKVFEKPHNQALKNYATGVEKMQQRVLDIGQRAGVCDAKGRHFDAKKSAAIQNIGEGYSNRQTDVTVRVVDADAVRVTATDKETGKSLGTKDYTFRELKRAYGREVASTLWSQAFDASEKAGGKHVDIEREVNTQPYTIEDLQKAYPDDWQQLKAAADEFRTMYDEYIQSINQMLEQVYPYASKYAAVDKITEAIEKKQAKLDMHKEAEQNRIAELNKKLGAKEAEKAAKKRQDTKAYSVVSEQVENLKAQIKEAEADLKEYEESVKDELTVMGEEKAVLQNAEQEGDSLTRMHRLEYREDYFHHFQEMASGVQNLKAIFTNNTDISPAVVGASANTKPKSRFAGFFQQRTGANYTADALNGMLRYGQLAEYKLAFDPLTAYLRNSIEEVKKLDPNATNRDNLIRYLRQWTNAILGKSHDVDRAIVDSGFGMRSKVFKTLDWINSRVIQNTLLWNMRSALVQISNVTNAMGIVTNTLDWANGIRKWALAARGNEQMQAIMNQSTFLASRYMDNLQLTDSVMKNAKKFAGWMLGALDEVSAKATWWAAYTQYQRNPNAKVIRNAYRSYDNAIDYADDVTRRTHAGRGVGELAPAMTSKMINLVAPFQVEVNNTYQLLKDNVKRGNYLGLLSTGVSVFLLNTLFESIVGSTPLGFDFIRAIIDICFGIAGDDPDDDKDDYGVMQAAQRLAGEFVGGLPYANLIAGAIGDDNAKKIFGEDTDMTRYGHTQIGINALMNTVNGLSDIASAIKDGKNLFTQTNFISDIDDLLNLTLPMGGKQLTRTAEGIKTVAQGYGSKVNKQGEEQVQFATEQDLLHYLHAGLFGKWALTEASEFFKEERLLPKLFGAYEGPKSSAGSAVDAKTYKAALATGISGKDYFTLRYDLNKYSTQVGKRAEMMEQKDLTKEQKAQLDALMIPDKSKEMKTEGSVVYQKNSDGGWDVKADYSSKEWMQVADLGDTRYRQAKAAADLGMKPQTYIDIYDKWKGMSGKDKKDQAREYLNGLHLTKDQYDYIWTNVFKYKAE